MALLARLIRLFAVVASLLIVISFAFFAQEQASAASEYQRAKLDNLEAPMPPAAAERNRERRHTAPREVIDDGNDYLLLPFASLTEGKSIWLQRIVPGLLGLLIYGFGLSVAANYVRKG